MKLGLLEGLCDQQALMIFPSLCGHVCDMASINPFVICSRHCFASQSPYGTEEGYRISQIVTP